MHVPSWTIIFGFQHSMVQERASQSARSDADQPWTEKFRPKTLDDVAAHKDIIDTSNSPASTPARRA